jgi:glycosyltransferase involved in cell wall biosynthesis
VTKHLQSTGPTQINVSSANISSKSISVVIPVFNSEFSLEVLVQKLHEALYQFDFEVVLVDDGSSDGSWGSICNLANQFSFIRGVRLGKNYGHHSALLAGVRLATNPIVITMDDDLQNPPEEIPKLLNALTAQFDVIYGRPVEVSQSLLRRFSGHLTRRILGTSLGVNSSSSLSTFRAFRTSLREGFSNDLGPGVSLDALLSWSTSRFTSVEVEHHERKTGKSNYNLWKLFRFMLDTVTGFSTVPLRFATGLGLTTIALSVGVLIWVLGRPVITGDAVPGFPFLAATIAIFSGTQLLVLGVSGQYIGRMHFRVMNKPTCTIAERTESK